MSKSVLVVFLYLKLIPGGVASIRYSSLEAMCHAWGLDGGTGATYWVEGNQSFRVQCKISRRPAQEWTFELY